jgi:hypothetical protein
MSKPPSVVMFHINKIYDLNLTLTQAKNYLVNNGFYQIGSGCESVVYSRKGFEFVIKLTYSPHSGNSVDNIRNIPSLKHFVPGWSFDGENFFIVVQKKVKENPHTWNSNTYKRYKNFVKMLKKKFPTVDDVCAFNCGIENGVIKCFDWTDSSLR